MFVCNFKINKKLFLKVFMIVILFLAITVFILSIHSVYKTSKDTKEKPYNTTVELNSNNYTSFLKDCHENINNYIGYNIKVTGYVYRVPDFNENQFVLARTMLYDSNRQAVVVGIMCECNTIKEYEDYSWVTIEGTVERGNYQGEVPIVNVSNISRSKMPNDEFVFEPID